MKVVMVGGERVLHIKSSLDKRFGSSTVEVSYINYISQLNDYVRNGEAVDRVVILDNGYMEHTKELTEEYITESTIELSNVIKQLSDIRKVEVVFLIPDVWMAKPIQQEMFELIESFRIVERKNTNVKTFADVVTQDLKSMDNVIDIQTLGNSITDSEEVWEAEEELDELEFDGDFDFSDSEEEGSGEFDFSFEELLDNDNDGFDFSTDFGDGFDEEEPKQEETDQMDSFKTAELDFENSGGFDEFSGFGDGDFTDFSDFEDAPIEEEETTDEEPEEFSQAKFELPDTSKIVEPKKQEPVYSEPTIENNEEEEKEQEHLKDYEVADIDLRTVQAQPKVEEPKKEYTNVKAEPPKKEKKFKLGGLFNKGNNAPKTNNQPKPKNIQPRDEFGEEAYNNLELGIEGNADDYEFIRTQLDKLSIKRASYVFAGTQSSGTSTLAYNIGRLIARMGFTVLLVGMDTRNKPFSYMTADLFDIVHTNDQSSLSLNLAMNHSVDIANYTNIEDAGFHVLTLGLNQQHRELEKLTTQEKLNKFNGFARQMYNFVIYDMSMDMIQSVGVDIAFSCDDIIYTVESTTDGLIRAMNDFGSIKDEQIRALMFSKSKLVLTKYMDQTLYFGKKIKKEIELLKQLDNIIEELTGDISDYRMSELKIVGIIPFSFDFINDIMTSHNKIINNIDNQKILMKVIHNILNY